MSDNFELVRGSGNVFRDFGLPNADLDQAKCILAAAILKTLDERQWSTCKAEAETGVNHADFARIRRAKIGQFGLERLTTILSTLGQDVDLSEQAKLTPAVCEAGTDRGLPRQHATGNDTA